MAYTWTYNDTWNVAAQSYSRSIEPLALAYATNMAISEMWRAYDWRNSVIAFEPFWLVPGQQDYTTPLYAVPTDYYGLREVYLVNMGANAAIRKSMQVVSNLERTSIYGFPEAIAFRQSIGVSNPGFRLHPCPTFGMSCPQWFIDGTYKKRPPLITRANLGQTLLWDDLYFEIFVQACAWAALVCQGKLEQSVKQKQVFMETLGRATANENLELGDPVVHPTEGLLPFGGVRGSSCLWGW